MTELRTKYWKCENIRRMASAYNNLVGNGRGINDSKFKKKKKYLVGMEEKEKREALIKADYNIIVIITHLI